MLSSLRLFLFSILSFATLASGISQADSEKDQLFNYVLAGMEAARAKIKSGEFVANGTKSSEDPKTGKQNYKIEYNVAFDRQQKAMRFDSSVSDKDQSDLSKGDEAGILNPYKSMNAHFIFLKDKVIAYRPENSQVIIASPKTLKDSQDAPFDVRAFGLTLLPEFENRQNFEDAMKTLRKYQCSKIVKTGSVYEIEMSPPNQYMKLSWKLWIDESQDFAPIKLEFSEHPKQGIVASKPPSYIGGTEWRKRGDTWIPVSYHIKVQSASRQNDASRLVYKKYDLVLRWKQVNRIPPKQMFTIDGIGAPEGLPIIDSTLGRPVLVDTVGHVGLKRFARTIDSDK